MEKQKSIAYDLNQRQPFSKDSDTLVAVQDPYGEIIAYEAWAWLFVVHTWNWQFGVLHHGVYFGSQDIGLLSNAELEKSIFTMIGKDINHSNSKCSLSFSGFPNPWFQYIPARLHEDVENMDDKEHLESPKPSEPVSWLLQIACLF